MLMWRIISKATKGLDKTQFGTSKTRKGIKGRVYLLVIFYQAIKLKILSGFTSRVRAWFTIARCQAPTRKFSSPFHNSRVTRTTAPFLTLNSAGTRASTRKI